MKLKTVILPATVIILLTLVFLTPVYAANPTIISLNPSSGTSNPNEAVTFTSVFSDPDGWQNIRYAYILINISIVGANGLYAYYDRRTNKIYMRNDANTTWLGGYTPGSVNVTANSYVRLNCELTTVTGQDTTLTINWNITFKSAFAGSKNIYLNVRDITGANTGWVKKGTWSITNQVPTVGTIIPDTGNSNPNDSINLTATYIDPDSWQNIQYACILLNATTSGSNCLYGYYNQNTNRLYLKNDANTAWIGGYAPGSINIIENSYVRINCAETTVTGDGQTLTINWNITFKPAFTGTKNMCLCVTDDANAKVGWIKKGTWSITNQAPTLGTITPDSGSSNVDTAVSFTTTYSDPDGWQNIQYVLFIINTSVNGANCFYGYYNQNNNKFYIRNDTNNGWIGGYAPGAVNIAGNTYAKINCVSSTVQGTDTTLTINWSITFTPLFAGVKNMYLYVKDDANECGKWTKKGEWKVINDITPPTGTISINNNTSEYTNSQQVTLNLSATDTETGVSEMQFSNDNQIWSEPETYDMTKQWTLTEGDEIKTVYVKYKDKAGNWSGAVSDSITLDTTPPQNVSASVEGGNTVHRENIVLNLHAEGAVYVRVVEPQSEVPTPDWASYTETYDFMISNAEGGKWIYVYFKDEAGNDVNVPICITYKLIPEAAAVTIEPNPFSPNGDGISDTTELFITCMVPLLWNLVIKDSAEQVVFQTSNNEYETGLILNWDGKNQSGIILPDGVYTYFINGVDKDNNHLPQITGDITIATQPLTNGQITIDEGQYVNYTNINLTLACQNASELKLSEDSSFSGIDWVEFSNKKHFTLSNGDGLKTIYAKFKDLAGNESAVVSANITLNANPPTVPTINPVTTPTDNPNQTISGAKSEDTVKINIYGSIQITNITYPTTTTWQADITLQEGFNEISINAEDGLNNASAPINTMIYYSWNISKPAVEVISPQNNAVVNTGEVKGRVSDLGSNVTVNNIPVQINQDGAFIITLNLTEGENTITAIADKQGSANTDTIKVIYDTTLPQISITSPQDGAVANVTPITVTGTINDADLNEVSVNFIPADTNNNQFTAEGIRLDTGVNTITATATDKAGNTAETSVTITLDNNAPKYELEAVSGSTTQLNPSQYPEIGSQHELKVRLYINDQPAQNQIIQFEITEGSGQLNQQQTATDSEGKASVYLTLDTNIEHINKITAYPVQCPQEKAEFVVMGKTLQASQLVKLTDETLTYVPNAEIELIVKLMDQYNNTVADEQITFTVLSGNGQILQNTATTTENGEAYVGYAIGPTAGVTNTIKAELVNNPSVNTTFNIQTTTLPEGITVESILAKVKENDDKIQDVQADMVITSNIPWADPELHLHIWQKGNKQKTQVIYPYNKVYIRPILPLNNSSEIEITGKQEIFYYDSANNIYGIQNLLSFSDGRTSIKRKFVDYLKGVVVKTEVVRNNGYSISTKIIEYSDWVNIPEAVNAYAYNTKVETSKNNLANNTYLETTTITNRQTNLGITDEEFE
jgi:hypothetical protein